MNIPATQVKELRDRTGAGFSICREALVESQGDIDAAIQYLRKKGEAKADKAATRSAKEGVISVKVSSDGHAAVMVEANCETDFVARDENFKRFVDDISNLALEKGVNSVDDLQALSLPSTQQTVEQTRQALITKVGENIQLRRVFYIKTANQLASYVHSGKIGVLAELSGGNETLAKDIAMQVAANNPVVVAPQDVPQDLIQKEQEIFVAQAEQSGKPKEIIEKMIKGRIQKYLDEVSLLGQPFIKDTSVSIAQLLKQSNAEVKSFKRFVVGEGIENV